MLKSPNCNKMNNYYLSDKTEVYGPYSIEEIRREFFSGVISRTTQVCAEGTEIWMPLESFIESDDTFIPNLGPMPPLVMPKTLGENNVKSTNFHYSYFDKIFKKEKGPCDPESLAYAWYNNRISKESMIYIQELDKTVPLWMIPDFEVIKTIRSKKLRRLLVIAAIAFPVVIMLAKCVSDTGYVVPDLDKERKAKKFFSNPENKEIYNEYMRQKSK